MSKNTKKEAMTPEKLKREGNTCIGLGIGVGALGLGSAIVVGAACPLCYFVAPALVSMGIYNRNKAAKCKSNAGSNRVEDDPEKQRQQ